MTLICDAKTYSAADMTTFEIPNPAAPKICLTHDRRCVFVFAAGPSGSLSVYRAGTPEIISLSLRYGIRDLLEAFPAPAGPVSVVLDG